MRFAVPLRAVSFLLLTGLAVSTPVSGAPTAPAGGDLEALIAKSRAASGAPYRYHVVSRSHETDDGHDFLVTTETEGLKYRARKCVKSICTSGFFFDGERSFDTNFNDTALPLSERVDALQLTLRAIASYAFTSPTFRSDGGQIEDRDSVLKDGKKFRRIAVAPRLGALLEAVIDPDSGLVVGVISDERRFAFEFRDQRKVSGKLTLPFAIYLNGAQIEKFDDRSIDPAPLAAPPGLAWSMAGPTTVAMTRTDAPLVPCTVGGQAVTCLFDSGNSGVGMSVELAAKLGLAPQTGGVVGAAGSPIAGIAKGPAVAVGAATLPSAQYVVIGGIHAAGYDVVLGADAFAHARIVLDYQKKSLTIAPPGAALANGASLAFQNFVPTTDVTVGGTTAPLAIDSGDASTIEIASDFAAVHAGAVGAGVDVKIGDAAIAHVRVDATKRLGAPDRGVVGSGLLQHFVTTFDYTHGRLGLVPRPHDGDVTVGQ